MVGGGGAKGRKSEKLSKRMEDAIFSLRSGEKLQLANAKASWKRTRSDPLTNIPAYKPRLMSGVIYWHYLEHVPVAVSS